MNRRLVKIDSMLLEQHAYLDESDHCYYFGEYTPGKGAQFSETNQIIMNIKKSVSRKGKADYRYKDIDIIRVGRMMSEQGFNLDEITFVPIPPSKAKNDSLYDDRLIRIFNHFNEFSKGEVDYRELVIQTSSTQPSHESSERLRLHDLMNIYQIDESLCEDVAPSIIIFDDVVTAGAHYKAMKNVLSRRFPDSTIFGLFIARTARPDPTEVFDIL